MLPEIPYRPPVIEPEPSPDSPTDDIRSVGELLVDADRLARSLLVDASAQDADALLRAWPYLIEAGVKLWTTLPEYPTAQKRPSAPLLTLARVASWATVARRDMATSKWPTRGPRDNRVLEITQNLDQSRGLVEKFGSELVLHRPLVQMDLDAARARILHILYLSTHAVGVGLIEHARGRAIGPTRAEQVHMERGNRGRAMVGPALAWSHRLAAAERNLGIHLHAGQYAGAIQHAQAGDLGGLPRLTNALARFDVQAHRALATDPSVGNLVAITRTHHSFIGVAASLIEASAATGAIDESQDPARIQTALTAAGRAWSALANRWSEYAIPGLRLSPELVTAAAELRAACRELIDDQDHRSTPTLIATRVDLTATLPVLTRYIEAGVDLAEATKIPLRDANLVTAPVRTILRRLEADLEAGRLSQGHAQVRDGLLARASRGNPAVAVPEVVKSQVASLASTASRTSVLAARSIARAEPLPAGDAIRTLVDDRSTPARTAALAVQVHGCLAITVDR